jgi:trimeric autotransporter adhesin
MGNGQGKPGFHFSPRLAALLKIAAVMALTACVNVSAPTSSAPPYRPVSPTNSPVSGTGGEVGSYVPVSVTLKDAKGFGIAGVVPTVTAVDGTGSSAAITSGGCGVTNNSGITNCTLKSSLPGTFVVKTVSPVSVTGNAITFVQYARALSFTTQPACTSPGCSSRAALGTQPAVTVLDNVGNAVQGLAAYNVTFTLTSPGTAKFNNGTVSSVSATASAAGVASLAATPINVDIAGTYTLTATATDGVTGATITAQSTSFTIVAGTATKLGFTTQPSSSTPTNVAFAQAPVVAVQDVSGNTVATSTCIISLSLTAPNVGDTLQGTVSKTAVSGVSDFSGLNLRVTSATGGSTYTLTASSQGACAGFTATSSAFTITMAGMPYQLVVSQLPSASSLSQVWSTQPTLQVVDVNGSLVSTDNSTVITVTAANTTGGATQGGFTGSTSLTVTNGQVTFSNLEVLNVHGLTDAGTYTLTFSGTNPNVAITGRPAGQLVGTTTSEIINTNGITPAQLRYSTQPANGVTGGKIAPVVVQVQDANGYLCALDNTTSVSLALQAGPVGGVMTGTWPVSDTGGLATFSDLTFSKPGTYQILATAAGLSGAYSVTFAVAAYGAADHLAFTVQPPTTTAGTLWKTALGGNPLTVTVEDAEGNQVANSSAQVSLGCVPPSGSSCVVLGTTTVTAVNGVATFPDVYMLTTVTNASLQATSSGLITAGSAAFSSN